MQTCSLLTLWAFTLCGHVCAETSSGSSPCPSPLWFLEAATCANPASHSWRHHEKQLLHAAPRRFAGKLQSNTVFDFFRKRSGTLWVNCGTILSRVPFELAPTHNQCAPPQLSPMYISECTSSRLTPYRAASGHSTRQILGGTDRDSSTA